MEDYNIEDLWKRQPVPSPDLKALLSKVQDYRKAGLRKALLLNLVFALTTVFICLVWYFFQPQLLTTKLGIVLVVLAMAVFMMANNRSVSPLRNLDFAQTNETYLQNLIALQQKQRFMQTTMLNLYFVLLSTGIFLYMYEYAVRMTLPAAVAAYAITGAWIALNWFYIRPKTIQKQAGKLDALVAYFKSLGTQLKEKGQ